MSRTKSDLIAGFVWSLYTFGKAGVFFRPGKFRKAVDNERKIQHLFTLKPVPGLVQTGASSTTCGKSYHPSNRIVYILHNRTVPFYINNKLGTNNSSCEACE